MKKMRNVCAKISEFGLKVANADNLRGKKKKSKKFEKKIDMDKIDIVYACNFARPPA